MIRVLRLLPLALLPACALMPPAPPPPPAPVFVVPAGTEFVSQMLGYSQAVKLGPWVTVSAQPGFDIQKKGFPESFPDQVAAAFSNLRLVLESAGATMNDVVEITTYQLDMDQFFAVVDGRNEAFGEHRPVWTAVGVKSLPLPSMQFQVSARAYVSTPRDNRPLETSKGESSEPAAPPAPRTGPSPFGMRPGY